MRVDSPTNVRVVVNGPDGTYEATHEGGISVSNDPTGLTDEELDAETGEQLPDRQAMSLIDANVAAPVNVAAALNVLSDDSTASATATQDVDITQTS